MFDVQIQAHGEGASSGDVLVRELTSLHLCLLRTSPTLSTVAIERDSIRNITDITDPKHGTPVSPPSFTSFTRRNAVSRNHMQVQPHQTANKLHPQQTTVHAQSLSSQTFLFGF